MRHQGIARVVGGRLLIILVAGSIGCVFRSPSIQPLTPGQTGSATSSVKAHLLDGSTIIYPHGFSVEGGSVVKRDQAYRYPLLGGPPIPVGRVPLDSIVGMEGFGAKTNVPATVVATLGGIAVGTIGAAVLAVAIFGSCPTFYADSAGIELLQGEGFSYAIAPLFEQRDVDRLRIVNSKDGKIVLRIRNEALETHYINHVELIEIDRQADELALGDNFGHPLALRNLTTPASIRDRAGRDIRAVMSAIDERVYATAERTMRGVRPSDLDDHIDVVIPARKDADSVALVLDLRNSLLNTVLLYDHILGAQGARSLDFLANDLNRISSAVDLGRWYAANMGMRISVLDGAEYRQVTRLGDSGPIAFHKVAAMIPAIRGSDDSVRIRLSFVADNWRIDAVAISTDWRRPVFRMVPASSVVMPQQSQNADALAAIADPDESYLQTTPGQQLSVEFDVGESSSARSWLVASQGYYTEWIRGSWIKSASGERFSPTNESLERAIRGWQRKQKAMELQFYSTRIATRSQ